MWHIWVGAVMRDVDFFALLLEADREEASAAREGGCPHCAAVLHRADYGRKPRGAPAGAPEEFSVRFSLCCSRDGCRKRLTPMSVRFLARRVYVGAAVVLVAAAMQGPSPARIKRLSELLGMTRRTARRWLSWWQTRFAGSDFFRSLRGLLHRLVQAEELPLALLEILHRPRPRSTTEAVLKLLRPITSATAPDAQPV